MKFIIFAGTPGSGKTSIIKYIIQELKDNFKLFYIKFDCLRTLDDERIAKKYKIRLIPTQIFLDKDGKEYFRHEGFFPKDKLVKILKDKGVK